MTNNQDMQNQLQAVQQMAQQKGITGVAYIDVDPAAGFLRLKLRVVSPEQRAELTTNFALALEMMSKGFNLQVTTCRRKKEEAKNV